MENIYFFNNKIQNVRKENLSGHTCNIYMYFINYINILHVYVRVIVNFSGTSISYNHGVLFLSYLEEHSHIRAISLKMRNS